MAIESDSGSQLSVHIHLLDNINGVSPHVRAHILGHATLETLADGAFSPDSPDAKKLQAEWIVLEGALVLLTGQERKAVLSAFADGLGVYNDHEAPSAPLADKIREQIPRLMGQEFLPDLATDLTESARLVTAAVVVLKGVDLNEHGAQLSQKLLDARRSRSPAGFGIYTKDAITALAGWLNG